MSAVVGAYERFGGDITGRGTQVFASVFGPTTNASVVASNKGKQLRAMQATSQHPSATAIKDNISSDSNTFDRKAFSEKVAYLDKALSRGENKASIATANLKSEVVQPKEMRLEKRSLLPIDTGCVASTSVEKQGTVGHTSNLTNVNASTSGVITRDQSTNTPAINDRIASDAHNPDSHLNSFGNNADIERRSSANNHVQERGNLSSSENNAPGNSHSSANNNNLQLIDSINNTSTKDKVELNATPVQEAKQKHTHRISDNTLFSIIGIATLLLGVGIDVLGFTLRGERSTADTAEADQLVDIPADLQDEITSLENSVELEDQISSMLNDIATQCEDNVTQITEVAEWLSSAQDQILSDIERKAYDTALVQTEATAFADPNNQQMTVDDYGNLVPTGQLTTAAKEECEEQATQIAQQAKNMASTALSSTIDRINAKATDISKVSDTLANASSTANDISQSTQTVINKLGNIEQTVENYVNSQTNVTQSGISSSGFDAIEGLGSVVAALSVPIFAKLFTNIHHNKLAEKQVKDQSVNQKPSAIQDDITASDNAGSSPEEGGNDMYAAATDARSDLSSNGSLAARDGSLAGRIDNFAEDIESDSSDSSSVYTEDTSDSVDIGTLV
ncbi:hypothetical protein F4V72_11320 [Salmonella enterica subsp. diarizonae]|uniref:Tir intimin-binding domain-containing protein n=1 Tax=Salmonella enterica TaxID=28901 RepID=UPI00109C83EF|nr:Tir intimin-binding domain-containing protein [Salmonella enterica]ECH9337847.1 hypothetical protein [Salmonella enterica subsp. diarizonae]EDU9902670.1 hypothetical protein [Salmonella enterica subsp. diarizonae]KAA8689700.1 hypothetical protein F4V72_11320 [Salmonella enterica subsp. diarizonae]VFS79061.1 Translocated intimin receptor (Tir) intimin-binding domain [Salmonella enterica subsp. diarizonae]HAU3295800.1 hypothetical protein [Salmonella enterica subsp. diarizonae]